MKNSIKLCPLRPALFYSCHILLIYQVWNMLNKDVISEGHLLELCRPLFEEADHLTQPLAGEGILRTNVGCSCKVFHGVHNVFVLQDFLN